jgi:hypothetical protein
MNAISRLLLLFLLLSAGCAAPDRSAGMLSAGVVLAGEAPAAGEVTLVGLLVGREQPRLTGAGTAEGVALALPAPQLPDGLRWQIYGAGEAAAVEVRGRISDGSGGPLLTVQSLEAVTPRPTALDELAGLSGPRLVQIDAELLAAGGSTLLVSELTAGGVPTAASLQFKVRLADDGQLPPLTTSGAVGYAPVTVLALWRDGLLTGLTVSARAQP